LLRVPQEPHRRGSLGSFHSEGNSFKQPPWHRSQRPIVHRTRLNRRNARVSRGQRLKRIDPLGVNAVDRKE